MISLVFVLTSGRGSVGMISSEMGMWSAIGSEGVSEEVSDAEDDMM